MNKWLIFSFFLTASYSSYAQSPTVIFAADKDHSFLLEQPDNNKNPLGNPISEPASEQIPPSSFVSPSAPQAAKIESQPSDGITEYESINPQISPQTTPQIEAGKIQNTIFQGGQRIYDVQSIPIKDINKVEEPNIQPTISTYPAY